MTRVVYVDVLFCVNLIVNYFLIFISAKLNHFPRRSFRFLGGAALGAAFAMAIFLPHIGTLLSVLMKLGFSVAIVLAAFGRQKPLVFLRLLGTFYACSFGFAGIMLALWFTLRPQGMIINNGVVYFNISPLVLILSAAVCYAVMLLISRFMKPGEPKRICYPVRIRTKLGEVQTLALLDTGNSLTDLFSAAPVAVLEKKKAKAVLPAGADLTDVKTADTLERLEPYWQERFRLIPCRTVSGGGLMAAFRPECFEIQLEDAWKTVPGVFVALGEELEGEYGALVSGKILSCAEMENRKCLHK